MSVHNIILPSKPRIVSEEENKGVYEIDGLAPGYGHTLGNSLRRIILSSLPGAAITSLKIDGVDHEFSVLDGIQEDVLIMILNLKRIAFRLLTDQPQKVTLSVKGLKKITAADIKTPSQVEVLNLDSYIAEITDKNISLNIEMTLEKGLGYVSKESLQKGKVDVGVIAMDAIFTPIRRVRYEVENMRVGDRTNHNRLRIEIETDGSISPREALERSIEIMINQLQSIVGFKTKEIPDDEHINKKVETDEMSSVGEEDMDLDLDQADVMKTRVELLNFSTRTLNALIRANIRTMGGIARKKEEDLLALDGLGKKGIQEIKRVLSNFGIILK